MSEEGLHAVIKAGWRFRRIFTPAGFQNVEALQLLAANPCSDMISLLQLERATKDWEERFSPLQEKTDSDIQEESFSRATSSSNEDNPLHELVMPSAASISDAPPLQLASAPEDAAPHRANSPENQLESAEAIV